MRTDPTTGEVLDLGRYELLCRFTDPDSYRPILEAHPRLRICLAHFGGAGDWEQHLNRPWDSGEAFLEPGGFDRVLQWLRIRRPIDPTERSWLAKIAEMLQKDEYENLWTDISYTVFADDEYLYLLQVLLSDERIRRRVLFGSDFYVVANARLEERRRSVRIRAVLGEEVFATIAEANPREYLGEHR
jgi:predicted TIM-barrel fold metal-dependent hydrolase